MELKKEEMQMLGEKSRAVSQVTFDEDVNVPDVKSDIGRMIQNKGEVTVDELRLGEGRVHIRGSLKVDFLYVSEQERKIDSFSMKIPMEETLNLEGIVSGDKICLRWEMEDLSVHTIHSRKLNIKAIVTFYALVEEIRGLLLPVETDGEGISVKKKNVQLLSLGVHKKDTMRIKEEMVLASNKPNVAELLWYTMEVRGLDLRPGEQVLKAKGELFVFALYTGEEEGESLQWMEYSLPFSSSVECSGCREEMIPNIEAAVVSQSLEVKPDADGEQRILTADVVMELDMKLYEEKNQNLILDVYTPFREYVAHGKMEELESLLVRNFSRCRISDRVEIKENQGKILQICHSQGKVRVDKTQIVENGIQTDGVVYMKVLYIVGNDEMPFYSMEAMIPFTHVVEAAGIEPESSFYLKTDLEQLSVTMVDSSEIEMKATVNINVLVIQKEKVMIMEQVEEKPLDMEKIRNMPGILVYIVKPEDTLWDIAKKFYTTTEEICSLNEMKEPQLQVGQPLLLVKKVKS